MTDSADVPTTARPEIWAGDRVTRWLRQAPGLERQLAPVSQLLFDAAAIRPGESVLDVGCGTGPTTLEAARRAGPDGRVTGLDIAGDMLAAARTATATGEPDLAELDWVEADVSTWTSASRSWDVVLSRFGVMFFADPSSAVRNLAAVTAAGGRLAVAVWGPRDASPLFEVPYDIALSVRTDVERLPTDVGPFSWHDRDTVTALLEAGGWRDVTLTGHRLRLPFAGGLEPAEAAAAAVDFGPTMHAMTGADEATTAEVRGRLTDAFADHLDDAGHVVLDAQIRIVTARR